MWNMGAVKRICGSKSKTPYQRPSGQLIDRYTVGESAKSKGKLTDTLSMNG